MISRRRKRLGRNNDVGRIERKGLERVQVEWNGEERTKNIT